VAEPTGDGTYIGASGEKRVARSAVVMEANAVTPACCRSVGRLETSSPDAKESSHRQSG